MSLGLDEKKYLRFQSTMNAGLMVCSCSVSFSMKQINQFPFANRNLTVKIGPNSWRILNIYIITIIMIEGWGMNVVGHNFCMKIDMLATLHWYKRSGAFRKRIISLLVST